MAESRPSSSPNPALDALLARVDLTRRSFLGRLLATGAMAGPAVASLAMPAAAQAFGGQATTAPPPFITTTTPFPTTGVPGTPLPTTALTLPPSTTPFPTTTTTPFPTTVFSTTPVLTTGVTLPPSTTFATTPPPTTTTTTFATTTPPPTTTFATTPPATTPPPATSAVLGVQADTFIREDEPNTNEGANPVLRVGVGPVSRGLVQFDRLALLSELQTHALASAVLVVTIANNHNTWGQDENRGVDAFPLDVEFVEGNGAQATLPAADEQRAFGPGATWNSPADPDCQDDRIGRHAPRWRRGDVGRATAPTAVHTNHLDGEVSWDVTADVIAGASGWMLGVDAERYGRGDHGDDHGRGRRDQDDHGRRRRAPGREDFAGVVEYYSREGATEAGNIMLAARLILTYA
ncbi:MAG: hypothetical protein AB7H88_16090 [Vicinamibacterales bacterium]